MLFLMYSCTKEDEPEVYQIQSGTFTDERDGTTYKTVKIGEQWWMAENLAYETESGSYAYKDDENNVQKFGRLYTLEAARKASPNGWHLPTDDEWVQLAEYIMDDRGEDKTYGIIGDIESHIYFHNVGKFLKSKTGWGGAGVDYYGFNAIASYGWAGGWIRYSEFAYWWSGSVYSNPYDWQNLFYWTLEYGSNSLMHRNYLNIDKYDRYSVRCVKD